MRHTTSARPLLGIFLAALIIFPNLLIAPAAHAASSQQAQILLYGYVKNQFGAPVPGALVVMSGDAAGGIATDANGYFSFTLFAGCSTLYELRAYVNNTQAGGVASLSGCFTSDYAVPDFIYNAPAANGKLAYNKAGAVNASPDDGVYLLNADGTGDSKIPGSERDYTPVWSPDGTRLAVSRVADQHSGSVSGFGVEIINPDGTGRVRLNDNMEPTERVAWSPDGRKIAYTSWGQFGADADIMLMNADGSNVVNLTNTPGYDYSPAWSPDGSKIAFASKRDGDANTEIYVMNADGSDQHNITNYYTHDYDPAWSPDGQQIAFVCSNRGGTFDRTEICLMNPDGSNPVNLTVNEFNDLMPAWSPDGAKLIFSSDRDGNRDLYTINPDGTGEARLTTEATQDSRASWQPLSPVPPTPVADMAVFVGTDKRHVASGEQVIYTIRVVNNGPSPATGVTLDLTLPQGVALYDVANAGCHGSTDATGATPLSCSFFNHPTFAPGETHIVTLTTRANGNPYTRFRATFHVASDASDPVAANNDTTHDTFITGSPVPVPTPATGWNALLAFETRRDGNTEIYTRRADGSEQRNLTNSPEDDPSQQGELAWSPDGQKIAFTRYVDANENNSEVFVMDADGSNPVQVSDTPGERDTMPVWSPDGSKIAFASRSNSEQAGSIHVVDQAGAVRARFPNSVGEIDDAPAWSPDGQSVAFTRGRYDEDFNYLGSDIYTADASGGNQTQHTHTAATADEQPTWSADGAKIAFLRHTFESNGDRHPGDLYLMNADGSNVVNLSNDAEDSLNFSWSPDGSRIAYSRGNTGVSTLYVVDVASGTLTQIDSSTNRASVPQWSPDGTRLTYSRVLTVQNYNAANVYIANADGTGAFIVGGDFEYNQHPVWSPDGTRIAFNTGRGGGGIDIVNTDGTGRVDLTNDPGYYTHPKWQPIDAPPSADISLSASTDPRYVSSNGGQVIYSVSVFNNGPAPATNITLTGQMPAGVALNTVVNDNGDGSTCASAPDGASFSCTFPTANLYDTKTVSLHATSNAAGAPNAPVTATFNVTSDTPDPDPGSNATTTDFFIAAPPLPLPTPGPADDAQIAYEAVNNNTQNEILMRRADGTGLVNLSNDPAHDTGFVWSPDGNRMAFIRSASSGGNSFSGSGSDIYIVNADGTNLVRVTDTPDEYETRLAWSPDGLRLAYDAPADGGNALEVFVINADGTGRTRVSTPGHYSYQPSWSPDGSRLTFTRNLYDDALGFSSFVYVVNADGSNLVRVEHEHSVRDLNPAWSPDSARLAFERSGVTSGGTWGTDIYAANPDGSNVSNVSNDGVSSGKPAWSPDGSRLFFSSFENNFFAFVTMQADGTNRTVLYNPTNGSYGAGVASWSPDGSKIVFDYIVSEFISAGVYAVNADGTNLVALGNEIEFNSAPDWSPDGNRVVFNTNRNGVNALNIVDADGTNRVALPADARSYLTPKWRPRAVPQNNTPVGGNVAVSTPGGVQLSFANVTQAGQTTVTPIDPNSLQGIPGEYVINANTLAFEIHTTAAYTGPITIGFNVPNVNNPITFSTLRVLHGEPPPVPNFVDRTILAPDAPSHNFPARTVYARVSSLSPFIIAERKTDTTPPSINVTSPAADAVYLLRQPAVAAYSCADAGSGVALCAGTVANGATLNTGAVGSYSFVVNARDNAGNTSQRTVNYRVAYGVNPLFDQTKANKSGSTVPIKLELTDAARVNQSASNIVVTALAVTRVSDNAPGTLSDPGNSNPDYNFRYTGGQYHFNLKTSGYATGTYLLSFKAGNDPTTHTVQFQVK